MNARVVNARGVSSRRVVNARGVKSSCGARVCGVRAVRRPLVSTCRQGTYSLALMNVIGRRGVG